MCVYVYLCRHMCIYVCGGQKSFNVTLPGVSFLRCHSFLRYETGSLSGLKFSSADRLSVQSTSGTHLLLPPLHWNPACDIVPRFSHGRWESNSGPHASTISVRDLPNEPSPNSSLVVDSETERSEQGNGGDEG